MQVFLYLVVFPALCAVLTVGCGLFLVDAYRASKEDEYSRNEEGSL